MSRLYEALLAIHSTPARLISSSPSTKRASVAIILRIRPSSAPQQRAPTIAHSVPDTLHSFFSQTPGGIPEVLFIKRASRKSDRWSAHVAFPGGREEPDDEGPLYTAMRETWEEVGIDLAEKKDFVCVGQLDDREITSSMGKRLLMVLSPFVFFQISHDSPLPDLQAAEVASAHWVPLSSLHAPNVRWGDVPMDIGNRIAPRSKFLQTVVGFLAGRMHFQCILLPNEPVAVSPDASEPELGADRPELRLWGLTLGMSLDLISHMVIPPTESAPTMSPSMSRRKRSLSGILPPPTHLTTSVPSMTSIFPTFSHPDMNLLIYLFGYRYRSLLKRWDEAYRYGGRVNWAGIALSEFYGAVRRALVIAILFRAVVISAGAAWAGKWVLSRLRSRRAR